MALIGIDLGTTNSLASYWGKDGVQLIPNEFNEYLTPSIVGFNEKKEVVIGKAAREMIITNPTRTFREFKRNMGTDKKFCVDDLEFRAEDLSAFVLKQLKQDAENFLQEEITEAIISVPAYFTDKQRSATRVAGQIAGLKVERLINEPSAAALAYRINEEEEHAIYLLFDFGGGTLDISVVDAFDNIVEITAVSGDNQLGGKDFNEIIENYFYKANDLRKESLSLKWQEFVYREAEECKIQLTLEDTVNKIIAVDGTNYNMNLTNMILKQESMPIFKKVLQAIQKALAMSEIELEDIDKVILVGGSSKMPVVQMFLKSVFKAQILHQLNPDEIVAMGAGVVAGIKSRNSTIKDMLLSDICPFSLGVETADGVFSSIISRNEILPCSKSGFYTTVSDNQKIIRMNVYQGNHMIAKDNEYLTNLEVTVPPLKKGDILVKVDFSYDLNGIFDINTTCLNDGKEIHKTLVNQNSGMTEDEISKKVEVLNQIKENSHSDTKTDYLIYRANHLFMLASKEQQNLILEEMKIYKEVQDNKTDRMTKRERYVRFSMILDMIESKNKQISASDFFDKD